MVLTFREIIRIKKIDSYTKMLNTKLCFYYIECNSVVIQFLSKNEI